MRGEVLHYDDAQGFGFITGPDGNQYTFKREDVRQGSAKTKGTAVEFQAAGRQAKSIVAIQNAGEAPASEPEPIQASRRPDPDITLLDPVPSEPLERETARPVRPPPAASRPVAAPPVVSRSQATPYATPYPPPSSTSIWDYFRNGLTANYVNFEGRARRKEYWGFVLFSMLAFFGLIVLGLAIDLSAWNFTWNNPTLVFCWALPCLWILATFLPGLAVTIRRQHDIGLSGWFYLLVFIPSVGGLIILVFSLIPSQRHDNKWGPVPEGVFWPRYGAQPA